MGRCGSSAHLPLKKLVQHVCFKAPDRAEYRSRLAGVVCGLLVLCDGPLREELMEWLTRLARNIKVRGGVRVDSPVCWVPGSL